MKLLSLGEIIWDIYPEGKALGGAPLNFAVHSALLGCDVSMLSAVGKDALADEAIAAIRDFGVNTDLVAEVSDKPTGQCLVTVDGNGVPSYDLLDDVAYDYITLPDSLGEDYDVFAFGTLAQRGERNRALLRELLSKHRFGEIYADINLREPYCSKDSIELCLSHATVLKVSDEELPLAMRILTLPYGDNVCAARLLAEKYPGIRLIIVTLGAEGSFCYSAADGRIYECAAVSAETVSTVGAGDSFGAAFLAEYFSSGDIEKALSLASKVSSFVVSRREAVPADMIDFLRKIREPSGVIFNIQKFCINDGPGIRTTVFLKGCPLKCIWCHNPESQSHSKEILFFESKCAACGRCSGLTVHDSDFLCYSGAKEICGKTATVSEIIDTVAQDECFYETSGGGMTLSGGEPLMQPDFTLALLKEAKRRGISTAIETSGFCKGDKLRQIAEYTDLFLFDYKETDPELHRKFTGVDNKLILENLALLDSLGKEIILRCPIIPGCNDHPEHLEGIARAADAFSSVIAVEIEPYHALGEGKYSALGREKMNFTSPTEEQTDKIIALLKGKTVKVVRRG